MIIVMKFKCVFQLSHTECWNNDQIRDFVRKLGFLDKEKDTEISDLVKHFLFVSEVRLLML